MSQGDHARITTDVERAVEVLRAGGLVGLPTETVYGLAADATDAQAVGRVYRAKRRPVDHPLIVHVGGAADIGRWAVDVPDTAWQLVERWWPGPLTVLLRRAPDVLDEVTGGRDTVALRSPAHPVALQLLDGFGGGLVAPSANRFGRVSPTSAADVVAELGDAVDLVLDGGPCTVGVESTIVDLTSAQPVLLRRGGVTPDELAEVIGVDVRVADDSDAPVAPGMLASHYAPDAVVVVLDPRVDDSGVVDAVQRALADSVRVGVLAPRRIEGLPADAVELEPAGPAVDYARVLYARLREADANGVECLIVVPPPAEGIGAAVHDRLRRAAHRG